MANIKRYEYLAEHVLDLIGGKENVILFTYCVTRLRFNVKDKSLVKIKEIEEIEGVVGTNWSGEQFQIIIGQAVGDAYVLICKKHGFNQEEMVDADLPVPKKKFSAVILIDAISGCLTPLIPVLIGCGMVKILLLILQMTGLINTSGNTYQVLSWVGDAGFYFLPILVGKTAAKKFNTNEGLGMLIGAMLIYPTFVSGIAAGTVYSFLGIPIYSATYTSTIFPVILCVAVMAPIQRFFGKISPDSIRSITEPLFTILVMIPITFCIVGPAGSFLGHYLATAILWLYKTTGFIGVALLASIMPFVVMTGMHSAFAPYLITMISTVGYEPIFIPAMVISNINQGAACAAVALKTKERKIKSTSFSCAITAIIGGVTEPGMYGINLRYRSPMIGAMIGSFVAGLFAGLTKVYIYAFPGSGGLFALPTFVGSKSTNIIYICIALLIGFATTFIATFILYKDGRTE